ncbi:carboxymuconolactone decarboxylase family protein [Tenacibaculum geojense]|uniref:Carboxymuconolactone decarboxylase family protein n=1 Tax=Tenacibaculum geojense TaxID=915352 RepID=A0ABW3JTR3_9FLAO
MEQILITDIPQEMMDKLVDLEIYINNIGINMKLLELIRLRVAQINGCAYCIDMHYKILKHLNETDLRLSSLIIWEETTYFTDKEKALLHFTEAVTKLNTKTISNSNYKTMNTYFSKSEIIFITLAITHINTWTRLMRTFKIEAGNYKVH